MKKKVEKLNPTDSTAVKKEQARFSPRLPDMQGKTLMDFFSAVNLIGYDNGDGDLAGSMVTYNAASNKLDETPLTFSENATSVTHVPNIIAFNANGKAELAAIDSKVASRKVYHNFKRCPGKRSEQTYQFDSGEDSPYTYAQLMGHSFGCAIKLLIECNDNRGFDPAKPTYIMVGRPSSEGWEQAEQKYAEILGAYLEDYLPKSHGTFTILILSESSAAMAGAVEMNQKEWMESVTQILDLGSSTFDITTVTPDGQLKDGEDSYQFGGNLLDQKIGAYGDYLFFKNYPKEEGYYPGIDYARLTNLRRRKELHTGEYKDGKNVNQEESAYLYNVCQQQSEHPGKRVYDEDTEQFVTYDFTLNAGKMRRILENSRKGEEKLPCLMCETEKLTKGIVTHDSWLAAARFVMEQFRDKTKNVCVKYSGVSQRLILTGGVSHMPQVRDLAKEVFGVEPIVADNPSQTVSRGLALILGNEIIKKSILADMEQWLLGSNNGLPGEESLQDLMVQENAKSQIDYYEKVINTWAQGSGTKTLTECYALIKNANNGIFNPFDNFAERACRNWYKKNHINEMVEKELRRSFAQMFPEFKKELRLTIKLPDLGNTLPIELNDNFRANIYMFYDESNCPEDPYDWDVPLSAIQRKEIAGVFSRHKEGLANGTTICYSGGYTVKIENFSKSPNCIIFDGNSARLESMTSVYKNQITRNQAAAIRKSALEMLIPEIENFVEGLTYYLAMAVNN